MKTIVLLASAVIALNPGAGQDSMTGAVKRLENAAPAVVAMKGESAWATGRRHWKPPTAGGTSREKAQPQQKQKSGAGAAKGKSVDTFEPIFFRPAPE